MKDASRWGFTLIELLTVIAIISILAAISVVAVPRVLEKARISRTEADMGSIRSALIKYSTEYGSFPPAYGMRFWNDGSIPVDVYKHSSYMVSLELFKQFNVYDFWSETHDTNNDKTISYLEFSPVEETDCVAPINDAYRDSGLPYQGDLMGFCPEQAQKQDTEQRPFLYIPYYSKQLARMQKLVARGWIGDSWNSDLQAAFSDPMFFPPPQYDGFVLVSMGPERNSHGIVTPIGGDDAFAPGIPIQNRYFVLALRAAFLGTRDANENGKLDFDFRARTRDKEGRDEKPAWVLPDGSQAGGPLLLAYP